MHLILIVVSFTALTIELSKWLGERHPTLAARWLEKAAEHPVRLALALGAIAVGVFGWPRGSSDWEP